MKQDLLYVVTIIVLGLTLGLVCSAGLLIFLNRMAESARAFL